MAASSSKKASVPEAKEAMNRFKEEVASELGVPLKEGYNGDLTSKQVCSRCSAFVVVRTWAFAV